MISKFVLPLPYLLLLALFPFSPLMRSTDTSAGSVSKHSVELHNGNKGNYIMPAPLFSLKNVDGKKIGLSEFAEGKQGVIVVFTCNHCPFAKKYEERIISLNAKYAPKGWPVLAINPNDPVAEPEDSFEEMKKRAAEKKYAFPYLYDETQETARAYNATRTPHAYLVHWHDKKLMIAYWGAIDNNANNAKAADVKYIEQAIEELSAGKPVSVTKAMAVGCGIKWK